MPHRFTSLAIRILLVAVLVCLLAAAASPWLFVEAMLHPTCPPLPASISTEQFVRLHTLDGLSLHARYVPPHNGAVIMLFGGLTGAIRGGLPEADFLIEHGYGVMQVDSRACALPRTPVTLGLNELYDAQAALEFLLAQPEVEKIGAYGFSMGGVTAIRLAARHPVVAGVAADGAYADLGSTFVRADSGSVFERLLAVSIAHIFRLRSGIDPWTVRPIDDLPGISPRALFLIYGEMEPNAAFAAEQYAAAREPKMLWIVPGGSHGANAAAAPGEYERRVLNFFNTALEP